MRKGIKNELQTEEKDNGGSLILNHFIFPYLLKIGLRELALA